MDAKELAAHVIELHTALDTKLEALRKQKAEINKQIKDLAKQKEQLPVLRAKRKPRTPGARAAAAETSAAAST